MIELYKPQLQELWFRQWMLGDEKTMSYNHAWGGTIPFPKEKWESWYDKWLRGSETERFYRYIKENDAFLGEAAYYYDAEREMTIADVIVYAPYRGRGIGTWALMLLCAAARERGVEVLYDDIAPDNPSAALFLNCGFTEVQRTQEYILVRKELTARESDPEV